MAGSKDKQKMSQESPRILPASLSQKPTQPEPSSVIPYLGHSPIPVLNRFSPLGSTVTQVRPNYQSALVSSYDPFQLPPTATPISSSQYYPKSSPYVLKHTANPLMLEPHIPKSMSPAMITDHHFPNGFHYLPHSPYKSLKFYREILHETKSVDIKPIRDKKDPTLSLPLYPPNSEPKKLGIPKFRSELPYWFLHWWDTHGPKSDILPSELSELITYFAKKSKFLEHDLFFPTPLLFIVRYKIPWIMKWNYTVNWDTRFFSCQFFVKWWDRFEIPRIAEYVYRDFPQVPKHEPSLKHEPSSPHSSQTALSVEGKSKAELQDMAQQILLRASEMNDDEDIESQSSSSCLPHQETPDCPLRWSEYPHGQDPNDAFAEAYTAYDLNSD
ncbi:hypothetical protein L3X38_011257 [Prunus dulcis]|uniref:Uncharacterized protein n=1 Tax=Prunus dulcis TaxID=3755 RepID=A0AAD4WJJ2_PRUDU|nr:hypothetical protein L3X38_011257 [Prunus dulcis]